MFNGDGWDDIDLAVVVFLYSYTMLIHIPRLLLEDGFSIGWLLGILFLTLHFLWCVNKWMSNKR